jgi:hypothetical protein
VNLKHAGQRVDAALVQLAQDTYALVAAHNARSSRGLVVLQGIAL